MSYKYSKSSLEKLYQCHPILQEVFNAVIKHVDTTIITGHRSKAEQNRLFDEGKSQLRYPKGKHNSLPSMAVDAAPYPIDWNDRERITLFAGFVLGLAAERGIKLRWGGDWNMNFETADNNFDDLWHFELVL
jgi:peptidoglycan LD-endopeptidase CwlK